VAGWALVAAGAAIAGAGLVEDILGNNLHSDVVASQNGAPASGVAAVHSALVPLDNDSSTLQTIGGVTMGVGGAFVLGGVIALLTTPSSKSKAAAIEVRPTVARRGGGAALVVPW
jgi:hypothetical protein